jgi:Xaa-Pro aminopeptidase
MAVDVMGKLAAAERELASIGQPDPLRGVPGIAEARASLKGAREQLAIVEGKLSAVQAVRQQLQVQQSAYSKNTEPPFDQGAEAVREYVVKGRDLVEAMREVVAWVTVFENRRRDAYTRVQAASNALLNAVEQAFSDATLETRRYRRALSDYETDAIRRADGELRRARQEWEPIFEAATREAKV